MEETTTNTTLLSDFAKYRPWSSLNCISWKAWAPVPEQIVKYGRFKHKWTAIEKPRARSYTPYSYGGPGVEVKQFLSIDDGPWFELNWDWKNKNKALSDELDTEMKKSRAIAQKVRQKDMTAKRKKFNEDRAKKLGVSIEEMMSENRKVREAKSREKKDIQNIDTTKRILKVGPELKALHDDIAHFMGLLANNEPVNITNTGTAIGYFKYVRRILSKWRTLPKSRQPK